MKTLFLLLLLIPVGCYPELENLDPGFENHSTATVETLFLDIVSDAPGLKLILAATEAMTYQEGQPGVRWIYTSGNAKTATIARRHSPEVVRVEVNGVTLGVFEL